MDKRTGHSSGTKQHWAIVYAAAMAAAATATPLRPWPEGGTAAPTGNFLRDRIARFSTGQRFSD